MKKYAPILENKTKGLMPFYMYSVLGYYSWIAYKENNWIEAEKQGIEALKIHNNTPVPNANIKWTLAAIYIAQNRYDEAIGQLKDILLPYQFKTDENIANKLRSAFAFWDEGAHKSAQQELDRVLELAHNYLYF